MMKRIILIPLFAVLLSTSLLLTSLDNRIFDIFLRAVPSLENDPSVLVIRVDDTSIENVGLFPWPRDIMADAIVFLREMGAEQVVFDLSYIDKSPVQVDPRVVEEELPRQLDNSFEQIDNTIAQVMDAFSEGIIGPSDAGIYKEQMIDISQQIKSSLDGSIGQITRDADEYFGNSLRFFGDSYMTLTMVTSDDIPEDMTFDMSVYDLSWIEENIALKNIQVESDRLIPEQLGMIPTIPELLKKSQSAGFVNAPVDPDGFRRRIHLVNRFGDYYYGQFAFVPLLHRLGDPMVTVTDRYIKLEGAELQGEAKTIRIPRSRDGSVLIKWPKMQFVEYPNLSAWELIVSDRLEEKLVYNLEQMYESGFFGYWDQSETPLDYYRNGLYIRESMLENGPSEDLNIEVYREYRTAFIDTADQFLNGKTEERILASLDPSQTEVIDYVHSFFADARVQYRDLVKIRERVAEKASGATCIVGVDATSMTDNGMTTFQEIYPNVGIHATITNMILSGEFLDDTSQYISVLIALVLSLMLAMIIRRLDTRLSIVAGFATLTLTFGLILLFFMFTRIYLGAIVPLSAITLTFASLSIISFFQTLQEKTFLRSAFSRYLSPEVISEIVADPSKLNLGGEKREMTAIFTDIRGFSSFSEKLDPTDLVKLLNLYLSTMSDIVMENRGTIDKYEGDAIIAFFGAPIAMENHAVMCCRTAIQMKKAEEELNRRILEEKLNDEPLFTRIGMNTGDMIVGNMGTANKMDYTIMGSAVNLAARLEGVNKQYDTGGILISQFTREQIGEEFTLRKLDKVRVVGMQSGIRLYELLGFAEECSADEKEYLEEWDRAMDLYEAMDFTGAAKGFSHLLTQDPEDGVGRVFLERCAELQKDPPPEGWDGIYTLTKK